MKAGLFLSSLAHVAVLSWGVYALPEPARLEAPDVDALPIEIVPFEELSQKRQGDLNAEPDTPPVAEPKPIPPKPVEAKETVEKPTETPAVQPVEAQPEPEPAVEQPKPVEVAEPEPAPAPEPAPVAEPAPEPEPKLQFANSPRPRSRPKPPPEEKTKKKQDFNTDKIAALLDRQKPTGAAPQPERQQLGVQNGDNSNQLTQNEIDFLRRQLENCWSLQAGMEAADSITVTVQMVLNLDGSLAGSPRVLNPGVTAQHRIASERALRAVQVCAPYAYMPQDKYDTWQVIEFNFDPSKMFQG